MSHAGGRPILFLPNRENVAGIPEGWQEIRANGEEYQANFVKIALNVMVRPGTSENLLPEVLRSWFGPDAGKPGRTDQVVFERNGSIYEMAPFQGDTERPGLQLWQQYYRKDAVEALNITLTGWDAQSGIVRRPGNLVLFVTLEKSGHEQAYQYRDHFLSPDRFQWQSQNRTTQKSEHGQELARHREKGVDVHLFVRREKRERGMGAPFYYCGTLEFEKWEGEKPITVWWKLTSAVPQRYWDILGVPSTEMPR